MKTMRNVRIALVLAVVCGLVVAQRLGVFATLDSPEHVTTALRDLGPWGYLVFVASYAAFQPFGIPGTIFVIAASLVWPWPIAFSLSMIGTMAASVVGFSFARFVARDWVASLIPARFRKYDEALERRALPTVFLLRLIFWMPPHLHAFFGVSRVRFATHFWGSFAGYVVPLLVMSYFGQRVFDAARSAPPGLFIAAAAVVVSIAAIVWWVRRRAPATA